MASVAYVCFAGLKSERGQFRAAGLVIRMQNTANPQTFGDLNENRGVVDKYHLLGWYLGDVQGKPKDVCIGLANMYEAGGNKKIHDHAQLELMKSERHSVRRFVADHCDLQPVADFELSNQVEHCGERFRLREHESLKLGPGKWSLFVKDHET